MKYLIMLSMLIAAVGCMAEDTEKATYRVTITSNWNEADHLGLPGNAHFSPVVAVSHNTGYNLLPIGGLASSALELVAELGRTTEITPEIENAKSTGAILNSVITTDQFVQRQASQTFEIEVSKDHPYISFVSMIAPSPDWVIGLQNLKLYNPSTGFTQGVAPRGLYAIDAGTELGDRGGNFSIRNNANTTNGAISFLSGEGFSARFATVEVELVQ